MQAIAQNGLMFATDPFDTVRYQALRDLSIEVLARHTGLDREHAAVVFAAETGYATPKLDVRAAVFRDGADGRTPELLLLKERSDGGWTLPGGWVDVGESPSEAVAKEVREERDGTGFDLGVGFSLTQRGLVDGVRHEGLGAKLGLKDFDTILTLDGADVTTFAGLKTAIKAKAGNKIRITVWRDGKK